MYGTPGKSSRKRSAALGDRFIPSRIGTDMELGESRVVKHKASLENNDLAFIAETYTSTLENNLFQNTSANVLSYSSPAKPLSPKRSWSTRPDTPVLRMPTIKEKSAVGRKIPTKPCRVLDAPNLTDDYYLNLLDWGSNGLLGVALGEDLYTWDHTTGSVNMLASTADDDNGYTSVAFSPDGSQVALGTAYAEVELWDVKAQRCVREMPGHVSRVASAAWNPSSPWVLSTGSRDSLIYHHDVRARRPRTHVLRGHTREVCGLKWSPDGKALASGGNDNTLNVWDFSACSAETRTPRFAFTKHIAAVKALAWCPWKDNLLASGGGTADRCLRFWNTSTGAHLQCVDTSSQVCSILWSKHHHELLSSHGFSQNQLIVWSYPTMSKVQQLKGHRSRVLHMACSPDGRTVVSAASDETLMFWDVFPPPKLPESGYVRRRLSSKWHGYRGLRTQDIR